MTVLQTKCLKCLPGLCRLDKNAADWKKLQVRFGKIDLSTVLFYKAHQLLIYLAKREIPDSKGNYFTPGIRIAANSSLTKLHIIQSKSASHRFK